MLSRILKNAFFFTRNFSITKQINFKVTVVGGAGGIGQPLSLLLKMNPLINELHIYDLAKYTPGVAMDLSHIETFAKVRGFTGPECLNESLKDADVVVIPAGVPRKPGMARDDLFDKNASIAKTVAEAVAATAPKAIIAFITNPVNSIVPIAGEVLKKAGVLDPKRLIGITTLDICRANTFVAEKKCMNPKDVNVPVICGHSGVTIVPLFSRATPKHDFSPEELQAIICEVQEAGTQVVKAKAGAGSATLSMAYSGARFINSLLRGMKGEQNVIECAFVISDACPAVEYFASPVVLGKNGVEHICPIGEMDDLERELLAKALPALQKNIEKGVEFVNKSSAACQAKCQ